MKTNLMVIMCCLISLLAYQCKSSDRPVHNYEWGIIPAEGEVKGRHENVFIEYNDKFYLIGGRGINPVNVYDPKTNRWETKGKSPLEIHHFQAVVYGDAIYIVGGMTGRYPTEMPLENIYLYYPETDTWVVGDEIPVERRRGSGGVVIYDDILYFIAGIEYGHTSGTNAWVDSYNLKTGEWKVLPDAPHIRDHFFAVEVDGKIYCIGGRNTSYQIPNRQAFFGATIQEVDVYDIKKNEWTTMDEKLPVGTAAAGVVHMNNKIIYFGGESRQPRAHSETQALDLKTGKWEFLAPLAGGRHGTSAILYDNKIYYAAGSGNMGGGNLTTLQVFSDDLNWKPLFNGVDLDGWTVKSLADDAHKEFWSVDNGTILCNSMGDSTHNYVWLMYDQEFENFELRLKFQAYEGNPGNSGVQVRSRYNENELATGGFWLDGPQVDIDPPSQWRTGLIYDETWEERRWLFPSLENSRIDDRHAPRRVIFDYEDGEDKWNDLIILCNGTNIQTFLNNIPVADFDGDGILNSENHLRRDVGMKGYIALQLHIYCQLKMRFKDIYIREID